MTWLRLRAGFVVMPRGRTGAGKLTRKLSGESRARVRPDTHLCVQPYRHLGTGYTGRAVDIADTVKLRYPLPIARAYARVRSEHEPVARLLSSLGLVEITARYVSLIGIAAYLAMRKQAASPAIDKAVRLLRSPSLGVWSSLARQMAAWLRQARPDLWSVDWAERRADLPGIIAVVGALAEHPVAKASIAQFLEQVPAFRNDVAHLRRDPTGAARFADLLVGATEDLLRVTTPLVDLVLVHVERIEYLGPDRLRLNLLRLQGSGAAEAAKVATRPCEGLLPGRMYLLQGEQGTLLELFPFFHFDGSRDRVYLLEGIDGTRPRFSAPHEGESGELYVADELKEGLEERASWLFGTEQSAASMPPLGDAFKAIFDVAAADGVLTDDENQMLRATLVRLGAANDEREADAIIERMLEESPKNVRREGSRPSERVAVEPASSEVGRGSASSPPRATSRDDVLSLLEVEDHMKGKDDFPPLGQGVRYFKHQNQAFAYLTRMHVEAESHMKATRYSQRAIQAQPEYWAEVVRVARDPHISYRRLTSLTSQAALDSVRAQVKELADARAFLLALTGEIADFEIVVRDGEECVICFHKDDFIVYSALGFDARTPGGGALTFRTYESMFDLMWSRALTVIDFERDVAGDAGKMAATLERIDATYQRILEARRLLAPEPGR